VSLEAKLHSLGGDIDVFVAEREAMKSEIARLRQHKVLLREALVACFEYVEGVEHLCKSDRQEREMWGNTVMIARDALGLPQP
jgi:hypothetical protein